MEERIKIANLSVVESKQLMRINASLHYDNPNNVKRLYDHIEKKSFFQTSAGSIYREALKRFIDGENITECIYCGKKLQEDYYLICKSCNDELIRKSADSMGKALAKERNKSKGFVKKTETANTDYDDRENNGNLTKIILIVAIIAAMLVVCVTTWLVYNKIKQKDINIENSIADIQKVSPSIKTENMDGFDLLGMDYDALEPLLGEAEEVVDASTQYFKSCGISVVYDMSNGMIKYVDNDGTGDGSRQVPIFGILPGADFEEARNVFTEKGIETLDYSEDSFMCMFQQSSNSDITYEIDVTRNDKGLVALVAARIVY